MSDSRKGPILLFRFAGIEVSLAHLDFIHLQTHQLRSTKPTTQKHGQHRVIALSAHGAPTGMRKHLGTLLCAQPIAGAKSELLDSFHPADPSSQFGAEQSSVSSFVRESSHSRELLVDRIRRQTT